MNSKENSSNISKDGVSEDAVEDNFQDSPKTPQDDTSDDLGSNPVLQKIGRLLTNSSAKDWKSGGSELSPDLRISRPVQIHEFVYIRDVGDKSLVIKAATPVNCQYAAGGYMLFPIASGNFTVELRDRVFDPDKLVDPKYSSNFKGKFLEVLASGEVARKLFIDVRNLVKGNTRNLQRDFEEKATKFFDTLLDKVEANEITGWSRNNELIDGRDNTSYTCESDGLEFRVLRSVEGWDARYELRIKQGKFEASRIGATPKLIFIALEKLEQENQLDALEKKLRELGLEDDS